MTLWSANAFATSACQALLESLLGLNKPAQRLRPGISVDAMQRIAGALS
jgi:hypothetical protein